MTLITNPHYWFLRIRRLFGYDPGDVRVFAFPEHKVAYVLLPKAASTSIQTAIAPLMGVEPQQGQEISRSMRRVGIKSSRFAQEMLTPDWFVFAVVRDPADRAYSAYKNKMVEPETLFRPLRRMGIREKLDFGEFLDVLHDWPRYGLNDHFMPQRDLLKHVWGHENLFLARLESFSEDWRHICEVANGRGLLLPELEWLNRTAKAQRTFSDDEIRTLKALYADDYSSLAYSEPRRS